MLKEQDLVNLGKKYQELLLRNEEIQVQVEKVEEGARDAIVRVGKERIIAVSEGDDGELHPIYGRTAEFMGHGKWKVVTRDGYKRKCDLLNYKKKNIDC